MNKSIFFAVLILGNSGILNCLAGVDDNGGSDSYAYIVAKDPVNGDVEIEGGGEEVPPSHAHYTSAVASAATATTAYTFASASGYTSAQVVCRAHNTESSGNADNIGDVTAGTGAPAGTPVTVNGTIRVQHLEATGNLSNISGNGSATLYRNGSTEMNITWVYDQAWGVFHVWKDGFYIDSLDVYESELYSLSPTGLTYYHGDECICVVHNGNQCQAGTTAQTSATASWY